MSNREMTMDLNGWKPQIVDLELIDKIEACLSRTQLMNKRFIEFHAKFSNDIQAIDCECKNLIDYLNEIKKRPAQDQQTNEENVQQQEGPCEEQTVESSVQNEEVEAMAQEEQPIAVEPDLLTRYDKLSTNIERAIENTFEFIESLAKRDQAVDEINGHADEIVTIADMMDNGGVTDAQIVNDLDYFNSVENGYGVEEHNGEHEQSVNGHGIDDEEEENRLAREELFRMLDENSMMPESMSPVSPLPHQQQQQPKLANDQGILNKNPVSCTVRVRRLTDNEISNYKKKLKSNPDLTSLDHDNTQDSGTATSTTVFDNDDENIDRLCNIDALLRDGDESNGRRAVNGHAHETGKKKVKDSRKKEEEEEEEDDDDASLTDLDEYLDANDDDAQFGLLNGHDDDDQTLRLDDNRMSDNDDDCSIIDENAVAKEDLIQAMNDDQCDIEVDEEDEEDVKKLTKTPQKANGTGGGDGSGDDDLAEFRVNLEKTPTNSDNDDGDEDDVVHFSTKKKLKRKCISSDDDDDEEINGAESEQEESTNQSESVKPSTSKQAAADSDIQSVTSESTSVAKRLTRSTARNSSTSNTTSKDIKQENTPTATATRKPTLKRVKRTLSVESLNDTDSDYASLSKKQQKMSKKKKKKSKDDDDEDSDERIEEEQDEDASDDDIINCDENGEKVGKTGKKIRNIIDDSKLNRETKEAQEAERERLKRLERLKQKEALIKTPEKRHVSLFLDVDEKTQEPLLEVDPSISKDLKSHQIDGIKFMWTSCYESVESIRNGHTGSGCVLAHCMGLGKTLQVISLVHTLMSNQELTKIFRVMVFTPVNALLNWRSEFTHWTRNCDNQVAVYDISSVKTIHERLRVLKKWFDKGGVFIMGYSMYANLLNQRISKKKSLREDFEKYLVNPGADLVVCDEGHILKNEKTATARQLNRVSTRRRVVLTGTPLQNNLVEYWCMVSFVKPNLLGTLKEFKNRFVNPIQNGQHADSTDYDVKLMKKRAHILHNLLDGCVQRKDYNVIKPLLPPKHEYALFVRLSPIQCDLYKTYLEREGYAKPAIIGKIKGTQLFGDFQNLYRICVHPWLLRVHSVKELINEQKRAINDFVTSDEDESNDSDIEFIEDVTNEASEVESGSEESRDRRKSKQKSDKNYIIKIDPDSIEAGESSGQDSDLLKLTETTVAKRKTRSSRKENTHSDTTSLASGDLDEIELKSKWWSDYVTEDCEHDPSLGGKIMLLIEILKKCEECGDKLLVFSHSIMTLDFIENLLKYWSMNQSKFGSKMKWFPLVDYFRIDGSTEAHNRKKYINGFNNGDNYRMRLFLISTKAGGIGINLVGANRAIIFDASWNPSDDVQSIYRVYRFGQEKPVYIYRFLAQGTMEEKIYQRQVTKQSLSLRVIDEHQLDRHFTSTELRELYTFEPDIWDENGVKKTPILPNDVLLAELLRSCGRWISRYHEHDSLLENRTDEGLTEDERRAAWQEFEDEKQGRANRLQQFNPLQAINNFQYTSTSVLEELLNNHVNGILGASHQNQMPGIPPELQMQHLHQQFIQQQIMAQQQQQRQQQQANRQPLLNEQERLQLQNRATEQQNRDFLNLVRQQQQFQQQQHMRKPAVQHRIAPATPNIVNINPTQNRMPISRQIPTSVLASLKTRKYTILTAMLIMALKNKQTVVSGSSHSYIEPSKTSESLFVVVF